MVDLVKIRRKAREKSEAEAQAEAAAAATESPAGAMPSEAETGETPDEPVEPVAAAAPVKAEPVKAETKKAAKTPGEPAAPKTQATRKKEVSPVPMPEVSSKPMSGKEEVAPPERKTSEAAVSNEPDDAGLDRLERFKREAGKRRTWIASSTQIDAAAADEGVSRDLELLRFRLAGEEYAVDIEKIVEIVPPRATTRVPNAEHAIVGIMSLRGTIVTVFDLRRKLGHPPIGNGQDADRRMIVVEREGETAGFLVDKVSRVVKLDRAELENHPVVSAAEQSDYVGGVFQASDGLVILLDLEKILASQS